MYFMVTCEIDGNYIDTKPLKSRKDNELIQAYAELPARVKAGGVGLPKKHILDNKKSAEFTKAIREKCQLELVQPDMHRKLIGEYLIQTFKDHFIAILSGVEESFSVNQFDKLVRQAVLTLNLLRQSAEN